jgi:hypothetical protein
MEGTAMTNQESKVYLTDTKKMLDNLANTLKRDTKFGLENNNVWDFLIAIDHATADIQAIRATVIKDMEIEEDA